MCLSDRVFFLTFPTCGSRLGTPQALRHKGVPNLPNLPNLCARVRAGVRVCACRRMHRQACARTRALVMTFMLGRLGRLGTVKGHKEFQLPNLCLTSVRLGT